MWHATGSLSKRQEAASTLPDKLRAGLDAMAVIDEGGIIHDLSGWPIRVLTPGPAVYDLPVQGV